MPETEFSKYLTRQARRLGYTRARMAQELSVSLSTVDKWFAGERRPKPLSRAAIEILLADAKPEDAR